MMFVQNLQMQKFLYLPSFFLLMHISLKCINESHFLFQTVASGAKSQETLQCNLKKTVNNIHTSKCCQFKTLLLEAISSGIILVRSKKAANLPSRLFCISELLYHCFFRARSNGVTIAWCSFLSSILFLRVDMTYSVKNKLVFQLSQVSFEKLRKGITVPRSHQCTLYYKSL